MLNKRDIIIINHSWQFPRAWCRESNEDGEEYVKSLENEPVTLHGESQVSKMESWGGAV